MFTQTIALALEEANNQARAISAAAMRGKRQIFVGESNCLYVTYPSYYPSGDARQMEHAQEEVEAAQNLTAMAEHS